MGNWHWPQWFMLTWYILMLFGSGLMHDKPKTGKHNGVTALLVIIGMVAVLHIGGFW